MATSDFRRASGDTTVIAGLLLVTTLIVAAGLVLALRSGESSPSSGSRDELIAEKARALSAETRVPSVVGRIRDNAPDIGAEWHPGVILGVVMVTAGAGYLALFVRSFRRERKGVSAAIVRGAAAVESLMLVVVGPLIALVSYVGVAGD